MQDLLAPKMKTDSESTLTETSTSKILIADDSETVRVALVRSLSQKFNIKQAVDGEQAWQILLEEDDIELVITDLEMPKLHGYDLINRIRNSEVSRVSRIPIIVITGAKDIEAKKQAFARGAHDFISKDFDPVELIARVSAQQKLAQTIRQLEESREILKHQATTDPLTKLTNRRSFLEKANEHLSLMQRYKKYFSILMIDIDHFKMINDTYGHQTGDFVLMEVAKILSQNIRTNDVVGRIGGEEFAVALPESNRLAAVMLAERLRRAIESKDFPYGSKRVPVTISLGIATQDRSKDYTVAQLLAIADKRLYIAKNKGRNRLCASDKEENSDENSNASSQYPKLDEAVNLIKLGKIDSLKVHIVELLKETIPLFELANHINKKGFNIAKIKAGIDSLKKYSKKKRIKKTLSK